MIIALTGTPGTGKTSVAEKMDRFNVIDLTAFIKEKNLGERKDEIEVDPEKVVEALEKEVDRTDDTVIEGHLSHHFPADYCVVLRCNPEELRGRLKKRDYSREKIEENVEAEALDVILTEAVKKQENIIEVDTTGKDAGEVAEEITERIEKGDSVYGSIDWTGYL